MVVIVSVRMTMGVYAMERVRCTLGSGGRGDSGGGGGIGSGGDDAMIITLKVSEVTKAIRGSGVHTVFSECPSLRDRVGVHHKGV